DIDDYLEERDVPDGAAQRIETVWGRNHHKRTGPVGPADTWWRAGHRAEPRTPHSQTALLVVDMQNSYFESPDLAAVRDDLLVRVNALIRTAREAGRTVVIARTEHQRDRSTWTLNMLDDAEGFAFPSTEQARLLDGLDSGGHVEVVKTRDSAFHGTTLRRELDRLGVGASSCAGCPRTAAWRRRPSTPSMTTSGRRSPSTPSPRTTRSCPACCSSSCGSRSDSRYWASTRAWICSGPATGPPDPPGPPSGPAHGPVGVAGEAGLAVRVDRIVLREGPLSEAARP